MDFNITTKTHNFIALPKDYEHPEDAKIRRFKDKTIFIACLLAIGFLYGIFLSIFIFYPNSAQFGISVNILSSLSTGIIGYYLKR